MNLFLILAVLTRTAWCSTMLLPSYPLAVKSPYLSAWYPGGSTGAFTESCPMFWASHKLVWNVLARIDGDTYSIFGCPTDGIDAADQVDLSFTATHTTVTMQAGSAKLEIDFFSPVSLTDYVRQSIPFSYLTVSVKDNPSSAQIEIFSGIDDSWTGQDTSQLDSIDGDNSYMWLLSGVDTIPLTESNDMATYGDIVFAADKTAAHVTSGTGSPKDVKDDFSTNGNLTANASSYNSGDLVGLAYCLDSDTDSVTFAIGLVRDPVIQWLEDPQVGYYESEITGTEALVDHFFADEQDARDESDKLDSQVAELGSQISQNYTDLLEASVRQIWGGMEITVPKDTKDKSKAKAFTKEIATDGNVQTLADLIPKALPAFYVLAPDYIRLLLEPIMEYTSQWPATYAFHDLGKHYPNATGETVEDQEPLIIDQTSVIHWMAYAYQKASGDADWVKPYISNLQPYADHLVKNGLYPPSEMSSFDSDAASPNQTVLAIYSAIGLNAFGKLSGKSNYSSTGKQYASKIIDLSIDSESRHLRQHYDDPDSSWISTYPFGFDKMLGLNTFNSSSYKMSSDWYEGQLHPYGMQFYSGVNNTVAEFAMWCVATSSDEVSTDIIDGIHRAWTKPDNIVVGPTQWNVTGEGEGDWYFSTAKSIVGSFFMPVAVLGNY